jgi:hypothetical protein
MELNRHASMPQDLLPERRAAIAASAAFVFIRG